MQKAPANDASHWAELLASRLTTLRRMRRADRLPEWREAWEEAWVLLNTALTRYIELRAARSGRVPVEVIEDLASTKSLDLMSRAVSGVWDVSGRSSGEIAAYVSTVAHNELTTWRRRNRHVSLEPGESPGPDSSAQRWEGQLSEARRASTDDPTVQVERREFVDALCACVARLGQRARRAWFLRVFLDLSTRDIATHPWITLQPGHVDVLLSRTRRTIRACMRDKGHETDRFPRGAFVSLWEHFRVGPDVAENDDEFDGGGEF